MTTYNKNNPETIQKMFNSIANNYDRTNAILSFQMHKRWNQRLIDEVLVSERPECFLDLCCGTGAIAFKYLDRLRFDHDFKKPEKVYMLDFSEGMLAYAQKKASEENLNLFDISYLQADAQHIPLPDERVDCATIAYGIRNVKQPQLCLNDVFRVLKEGGTFGILELTQPAHPLLRLGHAVYLRTCLPIMGKVATSNEEAYRYLCNSIHTFIQPNALAVMMQEAGFKEIRKIALMGGIATILIGKKRQF